MASMAGIESWRQTVAQGLPGRIKAAFQAGSRNSLLKQINTVLLVYNDRLYDLNSGSWRTVGENVRTDATALAEAAYQVLPALEEPRVVLLLLPTHEFLSTHVDLPGVARENLRAALELQAQGLLPLEEELAVVVNVQEREESGPDVALWMVSRRLDALFDAFRARGMLLASVMPRMLAAASGSERVVIEDSDSRTAARLIIQDGVIQQWMQVNRLDLEEPAFAAQWDALAEALPVDADHQRFSRAEDYLGVAEHVAADRYYSFVPAGAEAHKDQLQKGKRLGLLAAAVAVVVFLGFVPFIVQSIQARLLLSELDDKRQQAAAAREDQAQVRQFEQAWGPFIEFPRQNLSQVLLTLQEVISPGVLTSLEIEEGFATLEGDSPDPQSLLERLESNEMFTGVDFARATNNQRYFIDLRLTTVDFPAYQQWYFPNAR